MKYPWINNITVKNFTTYTNFPDFLDIGNNSDIAISVESSSTFDVSRKSGKKLLGKDFATTNYSQHVFSQIFVLTRANHEKEKKTENILGR